MPYNVTPTSLPEVLIHLWQVGRGGAVSREQTPALGATGLCTWFVVTSDSAEFLYKTTDYYHPEFERSLLWSDPTVGSQWPVGITPLLAAKDAAAKLLGNAEVFD
jgi:hypothetical protein